MRIRLFHKLFLIIAGTALLSALAMAAVLSLALSRGFQDYLQSRDEEELHRFAETVAAEISVSGSAAAIASGEASLHDLLPAVFARSPIEGWRPPPPPPDQEPGAGPDRGSGPYANDGPGRGPRPGEGPGPGQGGPPRRTPPEGFGARLIIFDVANQQVFGPPPPQQPDAPPLLRRQIEADGRVLGTLALLPRAPAPDGVEDRFLKSQYRSAALLTLGLLALAAVLATWAARQGTKRFDRMALVTRAVAQGDFGARIDAVGEDELAGMARNINAMSAGLASLDTARRRWLAEISHELRTPLAALVGELDALKDGVRVLDRNAILSLSQDAQRLTRIVQDLHFLAISDLSGASCQFAAGDALGIVSSAANRFAASLRAAGLVLQIDRGDLAHVPVEWDADRIDQLLTILLTNSERYTDAPGTVRVRIAPRATNVCIDVDDSAPSVAPEHLEQLFEPTFREDAARSRVGDGSGLGLAVARAIVRAHGGDITAAVSELGGLSVRIVLPMVGHTS